MQFLIFIAVVVCLAHILQLSCVILLIYWLLKWLFHETLVDQSFGKPKFWQNFVIFTYIQASDFCSILLRHRTTQPSQNSFNLCIFWKNILLAIISFLQSRKNGFCFWEVDLSAIPYFLLIFAGISKN